MAYNSDDLFPFNSTDQIVGSDIVSAIVVTDDKVVKKLSDFVVLEFTVSVLLLIMKTFR